MAFVNSCTEQTEDRPGVFTAEIGIKPVAYSDKGTLKRNALTFAQKGALERPYVLDTAPLWAECAGDGAARFCPTRNPERYIEIGAPRLKGDVKPSLGLASLAKTQAVGWQSADFDMEWLHAGHYCSWLLRPKAGWAPPDGVLSFPITVRGLEWDKGRVLADGLPVARLRDPVAYDADNPDDVRAIRWELTGGALVLSGIDVKGMRAPRIDPTLELQPDAAAGKDLWIRLGSSQGTYNYGTAIYLYTPAGVSQRALLAFDVASIPSTAVCNSATVTITRSPQSDVYVYTQTIYSIAAANAAWVEGTKNGATAGAGESCWNALAADGAGGVTTAWAGSAGLSTAGTDYEIGAIGLYTGNRNDAAGTQYTASLNIDRVAAWFGTPNSNYGMLFIPSGVGAGISASSDHATAAYRPKLTVEYTLPGGGGVFVSGVFYSGIITGGIVR